MNFVKTTALGGIVFLIPITIVVVVVGKGLSVMILVAEPMAEFLPVDSIGGVALANILAGLALAVLCFLAGLLSLTAPARKFAEKVESILLQSLPGYTFLKGLSNTLSPEQTEDLKPVMVSLGSAYRIGLKVEELNDGKVVIYFPGSPNAWSGITQIVGAEQLQPVNISIMDVVQLSEQIGRGTGQLLGKSG